VSRYTGTALEESDFLRTFAAMQEAAFRINKQNGWWDARDKIMESGIPNAVPLVTIACLGLVGTEVSEAIEAARKHSFATWGNHTTKDTLVRELAGTIVRCMDISERFDLPLAEAIVEEIKAASERGYKHGGKAA
jgi:hypothetical protein